MQNSSAEYKGKSAPERRVSVKTERVGNAEGSPLKMAAAGLCVTSVLILIFKNLYSLCGGAAVGVLFGAVNSSVWEQSKVVMLAFLIWSLIEALSRRTHFHRFAAARVLALLALGCGCVLIYLVLYALRLTEPARYICAVLCTAAAFVFSGYLERADKNTERLFLPCVFLILLFIAVYCSFTAFPPHMIIFEDTDYGMYGIIPDYIDYGAAALDAMSRM